MTEQANIRARLNEIKAEHQPEAWEADAFEYSTSGIGCSGCECGECGNIGDFDGPCPTSAITAALTAVLGLLDECESFYGSVLFDGTPMPTIVGTDEVRRAIEKHLTKEDA